LTTTQATTYERLLSPIEVGPITVRNRSVFTAHTTNMSQDDNLVGDQLFHYHVERARGGAGLIVLEANAVHPAAEIHGTSLRAWDPRIVEGYERLSEAVHAEGAKMVVQLFHSGAHANFLKTLHVLWSPSGVPSSVDRESPHVMDGGDIEELIESYAQSSATITSAGMDGVEVHLGHSYLPAQFLSPLYNRRTDEWGGSLENRMRLSLAILERVREHVAGGKVVGIRISGEELVGKGLTRDEMAVVCATIAERGLADYISVSVGSHHTRHMMVPPMVIGSGYLLDLSRHIRDAAGGLPVSCVGRINKPHVAELALARGDADLVGMTRAQIADPELMRKLAEGRQDEIRPCIGSNQGCRGRFFMGRPITCTVNPSVGFEATHGVGSFAQAAAPQRVLVVGAGPAGLKAAEVAAKRGHDVEIAERSDEVGGQLRLARLLPGREEIFTIVDHLRRELEKLDVPIHLGREITEVDEHAYDVVVVATGSTPSRSAYSGIDPRIAAIGGVDDPKVVSLDDILLGVEVGLRVAVVAEEPGYKILGAAEVLVGRGCDVTVVGSADVPGADMLVTGDYQIVQPRLVAAGVDFVGGHGVTDVTGGRVRALNGVGEEVDVGEFDTVVLLYGRDADDALYRALAAHDVRRELIGDALAARRLDPAIFEGDRIGRAI
jgi:2,4-dienoyl-CoA reductase-like NADH-dependent reductase (Old Yellow Enzyme family)